MQVGLGQGQLNMNPANWMGNFGNANAMPAENEFLWGANMGTFNMQFPDEDTFVANNFNTGFNNTAQMPDANTMLEQMRAQQEQHMQQMMAQYQQYNQQMQAMIAQYNQMAAGGGMDPTAMQQMAMGGMDPTAMQQMAMGGMDPTAMQQMAMGGMDPTAMQQMAMGGMDPTAMQQMAMGGINPTAMQQPTTMEEYLDQVIAQYEQYLNQMAQGFNQYMQMANNPYAQIGFEQAAYGLAQQMLQMVMAYGQYGAMQNGADINITPLTDKIMNIYNKAIGKEVEEEPTTPTEEVQVEDVI